MFGPRRALIRIVLWWSVFTALTGMTTKIPLGGVQIGFWLLVAVRFLFGMGEAGAYPNITRALHNWFPFQERGLAQGMVWMAGRLMGGLTPLLWLFLIEGVRQSGISESGQPITTIVLRPLFNWPESWRSSFWLFGVIGIVWCILFSLWFRNHPSEKASVNKAELELIESGKGGERGSHGGVPWLRLLTSRNLWALCIPYFCASYSWYFNVNYLPTYMEEQRGVQAGDILGALYKGGPLWVGAIACLVGGWLTDLFIRRTGDRKWGRRWFGVIGYGLCATCYLGCLVAPSALTFFLAISGAAFFNDLTMGASWATCQDIGRRYAAIVAGCMNTIGNLGGAVSGYLIGYILEESKEHYATAHGMSIAEVARAGKLAEAHFAGYQINFISFAIVCTLAMLMWFVIDATRPVAEES
jgi:MFS family permease